jgi:hypothetical protein
VQRVTKSLGLQAAQLPKIAVDLETIAAALAEAQRESGWYISALEQDLADIDDEIGEALDDGDEDDANDLYEDAVEETNAVLYQVTQIRDAYATTLQNALAVLRADGGDPAEIKGADELLIPPPDTIRHSRRGRPQRLFRADRHDDDWARLVGRPTAGQAALRPGHPHGRRHGDHRQEQPDGQRGFGRTFRRVPQHG